MVEDFALFHVVTACWTQDKGFSPPRGRSCHPLALRNQWMTDVGGRRRRHGFCKSKSHRRPRGTPTVPHPIHHTPKRKNVTNRKNVLDKWGWACYDDDVNKNDSHLQTTPTKGWCLWSQDQSISESGTRS